MFSKGKTSVIEDCAASDFSQHLVQPSCWRLTTTTVTLTVVVQKEVRSFEVNEQ
jgi:hypothetical protein